METEFVKSLQCNYERVRLPEKPDERRYQYCILTRGGIKGLLSCSLRYINGQAYLYYDITSKQSTAQLCVKQLLDRKWVLSFFRSLRRTRQELERFLLDDKNIVVYPEHVFQDVGSKNFSFLYLPYSTENSGMLKFIDFIIEHMDYEDEGLVECVYSMYEQLEKAGEDYLVKQIYEDAERLEILSKNTNCEKDPDPFMAVSEEANGDPAIGREIAATEDLALTKQGKVGLWERFSRKKKKERDARQSYREAMLERMEGVAVAEETAYDTEDYGQTVYMERPVEENEQHKLYTPDGRVAATVESDNFLIGKQKDEVDLVLEDGSVSRIHARISLEDGITYLEDLNSTNGTFKNGLRLQPYEKRRIEENDEIRIGKLLFIFR